MPYDPDLHLVWGTWDRLPLITPKLQPDVYRALAHQVEQMRADVIAIGGVEDHVHVLVRFPTTLSVSEMVKQVKGASSHLVTQVLRSPDFFKWQGSYGAFTVSKRGIPVVREYILNQEEHHRSGSLIGALERTTE